MSTVNITVKKVDGTTVEISIDSSATVEELKDVVQQRTQIPKVSQRLIFRGQILADDKTLKDAGLDGDGLTVHLVRHLVPPAHPKAGQQAAPVQQQQQQQPTLRLGAGGQSGSPFSMPGMGQGGMTPEALAEMMNNPLVESMMSNPQIMRSLIEMNPQMQQLMQQNPELRTLMEDPEFLRQTMQAARNPSMMQEMMRNNDRQMANLDSIPGGYAALSRMYRDVQEPMWNAASGADAHAGTSSASQLMQAMQQDRDAAGPNNRPLGNPWGVAGPPSSSTTTTTAPPPANSGVQGHPSTTTYSGASSATNPTPAMANPFASMFGMPQPPSATGTSAQQQPQGPPFNPFFSMATSTPHSTAGSGAPTAAPQGQASDPTADWLSNPAVQDMMGRMMREMMSSNTQQPQPQQQQQPGPTTPNTNPTAPSVPFLFPMMMNPSATTPSSSLFSPPMNQQQQQPPPVQAADLAVQFRPQLAALESMGFTNRQQNLDALRRANGNVNRALDLLLAEPSSQQDGGPQQQQ